MSKKVTCYTDVSSKEHGGYQHSTMHLTGKDSLGNMIVSTMKHRGKYRTLIGFHPVMVIEAQDFTVSIDVDSIFEVLETMPEVWGDVRTNEGFLRMPLDHASIMDEARFQFMSMYGWIRDHIIQSREYRRNNNEKYKFVERDTNDKTV